jgi:hypothetical protein
VPSRTGALARRGHYLLLQRTTAASWQRLTYGYQRPAVDNGATKRVANYSRQAMRLLATLLLMAGTLVFAGCGSSDKEQIASVFESYQGAVEDGDAATVCRELELPSEVKGFARGCERSWRGRLAGQSFKKLAGMRLGRIEITGKYARANETTRGGFFDFSKEGGRWYLVFAE